MRILSGQDIADFVKERQVAQVRALRQAHKIVPKLAIIRTNPAPVVDSYMKIKREYGADILVDVDVHTVGQADAVALIKTLNDDSSVHGIIVQLPIPDPGKTVEILDAVAVQKDVDGLHSHPVHDAPTPTAILWLLAGYNIELRGKNVLVIGKGRLVGAPLTRMLQASGINVVVAGRQSDLPSLVRQADIVVSAAGAPGLVHADWLKVGTVVVDAGVATDKNGLVGDIDPAARERNDLTITPVRGGVGPLTVCALFDNVIRAAQKTVKK
ncbi:MAG TPA: bifunctional 5,10-methylenetetrahydrofolate dehydrogenase/5,10-methenyltetrahydrofolate cyclohydrolase [Magnetospirillaceae bacterium]|nr:bifunctional 5,10-methylenetetrahydrofolate dehydrogenase/5,10-methenyltetrahydrofolate cyclohydrolase [Magnetospirillaceae bacterium]